MKSILSTLLLCGIFFQIKGQSLSGYILDRDSQKGVSRAYVFFPEIYQGSITDSEGKFTIDGPEAGMYEIKVSRLGYQDYVQRINFPHSELKIELIPQVLNLDEVLIVTDQRQESSDMDHPAAVSLLPIEQIQLQMPRSTPEAMMGMTGVWIQKTNHGGGTPFVRGLTGNQTLILVDGIRLNNATFRFGPNQYLNTIDAQQVERVEVLRGDGAVQYGSDALGGVVHLITKSPRFHQEGLKVSGELYLSVVNQEMEQTIRPELEFSTARFAFLGGFTFNNFGDVVAGGDRGRQSPSGYQQWAGDAKMKWRLGKQQVLTLAYQYLGQRDVPLFHKVELEDFALNQFDPQNRHLAYLDWQAQFKNPWISSLNVKAVFGRSEEGRQSLKNNASTFLSERDDVNTGGLVLDVNAQPFSFWDFNSGAEFYFDRVSSTRQEENLDEGTIENQRGLYPDGATNRNLAFFSLHRFRFGNFRLQAGGRFNTFGIQVADENLGEVNIRPEAWIGNLSLGYLVGPKNFVRLALNNTFRAPNINDLGTLGIVDFRYEVPSNALAPEKSLNLELGFRHRSKVFQTEVVVFRSWLRDLIGRVRSEFEGQDSIAGFPVFKKENINEAFIQGLETQLSWNINANWGLYGNLTFTYGKNISGEEPLRRIPPLNGKMGLTFRNNWGLKANLEMWYAAKQTRLSGGDMDDNRIPEGGTPGFQVLNLFLSYQIKWLTVHLAFQNIFDELYRSHGSGIDAYGRSVRFSTRWTF